MVAGGLKYTATLALENDAETAPFARAFAGVDADARPTLLEERTDWHRLTFWNRNAQLAEDYIRTGDRVYVEGRLEYGSYERDGVTVPTAEVHVREVVLLSPRGASIEEVEEEAA